MRITQIRNATILVQLGAHRILVDPMLSAQGALPTLKYFTRTQRRNPTVELPAGTEKLLDSVSHCLITHCQKGHFDHLDRAAVRWLRARNTPVLCMPGDADYLRKLRLNVVPLELGHDAVAEPASAEPAHAEFARGTFLEGRVTAIPCLHGVGFVGRFMAHGFGYVIDFPGEPRLYLAGDTILSKPVRACLTSLQPAVAVLPAGGARFDIGGEIIMDVEAVMQAAQLFNGTVIANHLEALDHCPAKRGQVLAAACKIGLANRVLAPADGESCDFVSAYGGETSVQSPNLASQATAPPPAHFPLAKQAFNK
jgi:L-ascorbate metabolism protein UlaG (beta-lactamase superfamily)